jgi:predicted GNAT family N-acyltransferase
MTPACFSVRPATWSLDREALQSVRLQVFVHEQHVPVELEWDAHDATALHLLALNAAGEPIGCVRVLPDGHIGRMAVLRHWRGNGAGRALLRAAVDCAVGQGSSEILLNAQVHALGFYAKEGFEPFGVVFDEAGIAHRAMRRVTGRQSR